MAVMVATDLVKTFEGEAGRARLAAAARILVKVSGGLPSFEGRIWHNRASTSHV